VVSALAIDIGTTSLRTGVVDTSGNVTHAHQRRLSVVTPNPGEVELDPEQIARFAIELARQSIDEHGPVDAVGVTNQRATTIVFDPVTGHAVGPAIGWQDLRTVMDCLVLQGEGLRLAPNQSATKARWLVDQSGRPPSELRFATIETWIVWHLTLAASHVTDASNAAVSGLASLDAKHWDDAIIERLALDRSMMPRIVDTMCDVGAATALPGSPSIMALIGDQQSSLFGQCCTDRGAKITFGTGAMLDMVRRGPGPTTLTRFASGCFPIVAFSHDGEVTWGIEAIVLSAGACIEWLRDDLGLIDEAADTDALASSVPSSEGVSFVPALSGLGTPHWDFGARGGFFGITRGTTRAHLVRAVLEGIAQRGADLVEAAERETGVSLQEVRVDGGMSENRFLVQRLADFTGASIAVSTEREATTRGAGLMALVSAGHLSLADVGGLWRPREVFTPTITETERTALRAQWHVNVERSARTIPALSSVQF